MKDYTKKVKITFEADEKSLDNVDKKVKELTPKEFFKGVTTSIIKADIWKKMFYGFLDGLKKTFKEAWGELDSILDYSRLSNAKTRELAFTYGFSGNQAYGFEKAKSIMGMQSDEDLMYMTSDQANKFQELMSKYSERYTQLYDSGFFDTLEDFQYEMEDLKQELMLEVVEFFVENRDTIKTGFKAAIKFFEITIKALDWIVDLLGGKSSRSASDRAAATADIINQSSINNSSNKSTPVNINTVC